MVLPFCGPRPRLGSLSAMAYDEHGQRLVIMGGQSPDTQASVDEVWEY